MGSIISRWRKNKSTTEVLEGIDKNIAQLEKFRKSNQELRSRVIGNLIIYSVLLYIVACISLYFLINPTTWKKRGLQVLPVLCFPFIIYLLKRCLHWWFVRKISRNEVELQTLRDERKEILENVMETETYKKAKEILEKFDPETKKKLEEERQRKENPTPIPPTPGTDLRRRNPRSPGGNTAPGISGTPAMTPLRGPVNPAGAPNMTPVNGNFRTPHPPAMLPRPLIQQNRSSMEKIVEYFVGDGPGNRYALICKNCFSHNGMALREEFEYIEYRCAYCRFFNPSRKQRPTAPRLQSHESLVPSSGQMPKPNDRDSGNDGSPPPSSKSSDNDETEQLAESPVKLPDILEEPKKLDFVENSNQMNEEQDEEISPATE
uniref:Endoplasmic reticulum junction formation protein lunapark n=1 Tax=Ciona savignyi TaxID=51511 RepID=H2ZLJ1_CIOSA